MLPKRIVLTGPESSGKTTLAQQLATHFQTSWNPEFARQYLSMLDRPYQQHDLLTIARGQVAAEQHTIQRSLSSVIFLDTSLEVIKIWSEYRFGNCHAWILEQLQAQIHDLYLLCKPDIPWQPDPLRQNPDDRDELFERYREELIRLNTNFVEIDGINAKRIHKAIYHVKNFFGKIPPLHA